MNRRILIIDDNREIHEDIKKILNTTQADTELDELESQILGTQVTSERLPEVTIDSALQGQDGVDMGFKAWKEGEPYALAFVDVRMPPGLDGIETIRKIRAFDKELQFVIITAYSDYDWHQINQAVDPDDALLILKKPFDSIEIRQMTSALTEKWTLSRGLKEKTRLLQEVNQTLQTEIEAKNRLEQSQQDLLDRLEIHVRELNCFYELTRLTQKPDMSLDTLFKEFVRFIPAAFSRPDRTWARLTCEEISHGSDNFRETRISLSVPILDHGTPLGRIEIFLDKTQDSQSPPAFTPSEQVLINVLADQITKTVERIKAEQRVTENEKKIRLIMNSTAEGIYGLDFRGRCIFCNRSCARILGYDDQEEFLGRNMHDLIHHTHEDGEHFETEDCAVLRCCREKIEVHQSKDIFWKKDNTAIPVEYWAYPIYKDDEVIGVVVTFVDITERVQAEAEKEKFQAALRQAQKMEAIGTLAGGIAHDFNNILFPLLGYAELLNADIPKDSPLRDYTREILQAGIRAKDLVKQILTFSRQADHHPSPLNPHLIINEALKLLRAGFSSKIKILKKIEKIPGMVLADPTHIHQIIMNLATNAFHAMEEAGGILCVTLTQVQLPSDTSPAPGLPGGSYALITIEDTGPGIPETILEHIFDPYFTTKEKGKGTGLGLSVVQGIVKTMKGEILVRSTPGQGTWFGIYLPVNEDSIPVETVPPADITGGTDRILVVDDENTIVRIQHTLLSRLGYQVTPETSSLKALDIFTRSCEAFDLVITDMNMPDMDGLELARQIRLIRPDIPIIICTGFGNQISPEECRSYGIDDVVLKPVVINELASSIRRALNPSESKG